MCHIIFRLENKSKEYIPKYHIHSAVESECSLRGLKPETVITGLSSVTDKSGVKKYFPGNEKRPEIEARG